MSNKTRSIIKALAVVLVILGVAIHLQWVSIHAINAYHFWFVVIAFGLVLIGSR